MEFPLTDSSILRQIRDEFESELEILLKSYSSLPPKKKYRIALQYTLWKRLNDDFPTFDAAMNELDAYLHIDPLYLHFLDNQILSMTYNYPKEVIERIIREIKTRYRYEPFQFTPSIDTITCEYFPPPSAFNPIPIINPNFQLSKKHYIYVLLFSRDETGISSIDECRPFSYFPTSKEYIKMCREEPKNCPPEYIEKYEHFLQRRKACLTVASRMWDILKVDDFDRYNDEYIVAGMNLELALTLSIVVDATKCFRHLHDVMGTDMFAAVIKDNMVMIAFAIMSGNTEILRFLEFQPFLADKLRYRENINTIQLLIPFAIGKCNYNIASFIISIIADRYPGKTPKLILEEAINVYMRSIYDYKTVGNDVVLNEFAMARVVQRCLLWQQIDSTNSLREILFRLGRFDDVKKMIFTDDMADRLSKIEEDCRTPERLYQRVIREKNAMILELLTV